MKNCNHRSALLFPSEVTVYGVRESFLYIYDFIEVVECRLILMNEFISIFPPLDNTNTWTKIEF